jgi:hypothetical protein
MKDQVFFEKKLTILKQTVKNIYKAWLNGGQHDQILPKNFETTTLENFGTTMLENNKPTHLDSVFQGMESLLIKERREGGSGIGAREQYQQHCNQYGICNVLVCILSCISALTKIL